MMNRFFTLLFAASCLTAVGQGDGQCTDCLACNYGQIENCVYPPIDGQTCSGGCLGFGSDPYGGSAVVDVAVAFQDPQIMELWVNIFNSIDPSLSSAIGQVMLTINDEVYGTLEMNGPLVDGCGVDDGFGYGYWTYENFNFIPMTHSLWQCGSNELSLIHVPPAISLCAPVVIWEGTVDNPLIPVDAVGVCGGDCELDWNGNGVCDDIEVFGCTYSSATNFNSLATADDGSCVFENNVNPPCGEGTAWDAVSLTCIVANPADINNDGCVQLNDLLDLLSAYGDCEAEESAWQCGDPLEYQGYDYETVQIGEQCWFAENLRALHYSDDSPIASGLSIYEWWLGFVEGQTALYGGTSGFCYAMEPTLCDTTVTIDFGRLYNWEAVVDPRGLCPSGWSVPSDEQWMTLEQNLGMCEVQAQDSLFRGEFQGHQLKSSSDWLENGNGSNELGFNARPGGGINVWHGSDGIQQSGFWWTSTEKIEDWSSDLYRYAWVRGLFSYSSQVYRSSVFWQYGNSVRCIKDAN